MVLADGFVFVWLGGAVVVGLLGFVFVVVAAVLRGVRCVVRLLAGGGDAAGRAGRACGRPGCGQVNAAGARYCGRCGEPLSAGPDVDRYG